nr:MAG TPA: hypothetical protein [Caudoviricetes sp.]
MFCYIYKEIFLILIISSLIYFVLKFNYFVLHNT